MTNSYINIVTFLLTTLLYYITLKPALPYSLYNNKEKYKKYVSDNYMYLAIYVLLIIIVVHSPFVAFYHYHHHHNHNHHHYFVYML